MYEYIHQHARVHTYAHICRHTRHVGGMYRWIADAIYMHLHANTRVLAHIRTLDVKVACIYN